MAQRRTSRARNAQIAFEALSIEGGLLSPEWLSKVAQLGAEHQTEADYRIPKGLNLRDEIGRFWRIGQAHWKDYSVGLVAKSPAQPLTERFVLGLLRESFGFTSLVAIQPVVISEHTYQLGHAALSGRVPMVVAPAASGLDTLSPIFGDGGRRRSPFGLVQEFLNAAEGSLWGIVSDGTTLRLLRDNASLTRPAWLEVDLGRIFAEERYADFAALWLLLHETRFGRNDQPASECALEVWREAGKKDGTRAREHLRQGVEDALAALGQGFLAHPENQSLRAALQEGSLSTTDYFSQLLRLVYRFIFLLTVEERNLLHPEGTEDSTRQLYAEGYSLHRLAERAVKRSAHDRFPDLWESVQIVLHGLAEGETRLGLAALAGIFSRAQCPALDSSKLENRSLLLAVFKLAWLKTTGVLARVNWRDMGPEELGGIYESLLELVPQISLERRIFSFATGNETRGNTRKKTGSYYTPDSLVSVVLDNTLEVIIANTIASNPAKPVEALLRLAIIDPACGSGHFLLAAARRLAARVARLQVNGTPSKSEYQHALRQVVGKCIFGVDLNPMAVELCKVSLWMEAVEPGLPLTFLNSHIQFGNALLGTTHELMAKGVPDAAWDPIEGDNRKVSSALKKRNKQEASGQRGLDMLWSEPPTDSAQIITNAVTELEAASDADAADLAVKEAKWDGILTSAGYRVQKFAADAWCAAFVWPKQSGPLSEAAPTNELWRQLRDEPRHTPPLTKRTVEELGRQYRFFHWHLQFPQVFAKGGFDVVVGNPPWERVKIQEEEWFAERAPQIAEARNASARKQLIANLKSTTPLLSDQFQAEQRIASGEAALLTRTDRYPLCGRGDVNTYSVFAELACSSLSPSGIAGIILPPGILTDDTNKSFARELVDTHRLRAFLAFTNRGYTFPEVESTMAFALLVAGKTGSGRFRVAGQLWSVDDLRDPNRNYELSIEDIALFNPNTRSLPVFRSLRDLQIVRSIYQRLGVIENEAVQLNPWAVEMGTMFHMAGASTHFLSRKELERDGWSLSGNRFTRASSAYLPLYESKLAHQYNHRHATFGELEESADFFARKAKTGKPKENQLDDPTWLPIPRYWLPSTVVQNALGSAESWLLAYRRTINAVADARSVVASILPVAGVGDSLFLIRGLSARNACFFCAAMNSFVFDYIARQKATGGNLSFYVLKQLPFPTLAQIDATILEFVAQRVLELTFNADDLQPFAEQCGYAGPAFRWDKDRRMAIRAELDAAFLWLYGIERNDAGYILDCFDVIRRRDETEFGEYRTKRLVLAAYDSFCESRRNGLIYKSSINPPVSSFRCAHKPRLPEEARTAALSGQKFLLTFVHSFLRQTIGETTFALLDAVFHLMRHRAHYESQFTIALGSDCSRWLTICKDSPPNAEFVPFLKRLEADGWIAVDLNTGGLSMTEKFPSLPFDAWRNYDVSATLRVVAQQPEITQLLLAETGASLASHEFVVPKTG